MLKSAVSLGNPEFNDFGKVFDVPMDEILVDTVGSVGTSTFGGDVQST